jgi:uncharacterized protein YebE (UPF0316 family)
MDLFHGVNAFSVPAALVPVLIFFARICDVSLGTLRIMVVGRGMRVYASLLGFMEVFIWLLAISQVLQNLTGIVSYVAYCGGFAAGTFVGMTIERRLAFGTAMIRIIVPGEATDLVNRLVGGGHRITRLVAKGERTPVEIIFSIVKRKSLADVLKIIKGYKPDIFYSVEDVRMVKNYEGAGSLWMKHRDLLQPFFWFRKSK